MSSPLDQFRLAWAVADADGPACRWPRLVPAEGLAWCCGDMQGMGVPAECLPMPLSAYSVNGWTLAVDASGIRLEQGAPDPRTGTCSPKNEGGCRRHLEANRDSARRAWRAWLALQKALENLAKSAGTPCRPQEPPAWRPLPPGSGRRWARYA